MSRAESGSRPRIALAAYAVHEHAGAERAVVETIRHTSDRIRWIVVSRSVPHDLAPHVDFRRAPAPDRPHSLRLTVFLLTAGLRLAFTRRTLLHVSGPVLLQRADLVTVQFLRDLFYETIGAERRLATRIHVALENRFLRRARALAAPSLMMKRELERRFPGTPVYLTPNGVDVDRFRPDAADRSALRSDFEVPDARCVGLFVGNAFTQKGLPIAIEAVGRVRAAGADVELWVCGLGAPDRYLELAERTGAGGAVRFFGVRRDIERFYRAADVFVFPSVYETFPLSTLEAAASETPLVVTPVGGMEELIGDGGAGILVERTVDAVADAMLQLARDPDLRATLGREARRRAAGYTWDRAIDALLALYADLLGKDLVNRESGTSRESAA